VKQLETLLDRLETASDQCHRKLLRVEEARRIVEETDRKLQELLPEDSAARRIFERQRSKPMAWWTEVGSGGWADQSHCNNLLNWIEFLHGLLNEFEPEFLRRLKREKTQFFLPAGEIYVSTKLLFNVFKRANTSLEVIDGYLDDEVFNYIDSLSDSITMRFLTSTPKSIFKKLYDALRQRRPNIEARKNPDFHDRFLIIDGSEVWHLGASINGIGKKAFMLSKLTDQNEVSRLLTDYSKWWAEGVPV